MGFIGLAIIALSYDTKESTSNNVVARWCWTGVGGLRSLAERTINFYRQRSTRNCRMDKAGKSS